MATPVVMPRQGQSVESCIIAGWKKKVGDPIAEGEVLCEIETDKAMMEVESPVAGTVLALFFNEGDDVPVLTNIAAVGQPGEDVKNLRPDGAVAQKSGGAEEQGSRGAEEVDRASVAAQAEADGRTHVSPRARHLAGQKGVEVAALRGSGPGGRIIERDVQAAISQKPRMTPLAKSMLKRGEYQAPAQGSGAGGRVTAQDLKPVAAAPQPIPQEEAQVIPVKGIRRVIATRMLESLQTTAQLTLNAAADARALLAYRQRLKQSAEALGLRQVTINDLILLAVSRILLEYPALNAHFKEDAIYQYPYVHLGLAIDTPRGLMVPVIHNAHKLSLKQIAGQSKQLAAACLDGTISADQMAGGTFTITNLGNLGIESFTPVLNPPQVAILGLGNINLKPVKVEDKVQFIEHLGLSLTINHQALDGAPAARFLQALSQGLAQIELLLAL